MKNLTVLRDEICRLPLKLLKRKTVWGAENNPPSQSSARLIHNAKAIRLSPFIDYNLIYKMERPFIANRNRRLALPLATGTAAPPGGPCI
ncbi:hypothetical protein CDAR_309891 [Caerostris darwini]|uniref:Uncharacterized protein n=1 Tax=Caerostris darwini TaxID=1538125 RepID=A0AAV4VZA2_9ARAC|nr:hypothetical protein CDAR_309891 [Caerostris darwini]